jgi:hypothetical protein
MKSMRHTLMATHLESSSYLTRGYKANSKTKYVCLPLPSRESPFITIIQRNALHDKHLFFVRRQISRDTLPHLVKIGNYYVGVRGKMHYDASSKWFHFVFPTQLYNPEHSLFYSYSRPCCP